MFRGYFWLCIQGVTLGADWGTVYDARVKTNADLSVRQVP